MRSLLRNKKAQTGFEDGMYVLVYIFAAALLVFILYFVFSQVDDPFSQALGSAIPEGETSFNVTQASSQTLGSVGIFNTLFPFLLTGLIGMVIVSAMFMDSHPVFFFVSLIILGVVILLGIVFSNIYQQITTDTAFGDTADNFSIMNIFLKKLPWVIAIVIFIIAIVLYSKSGSSGGGGL